MKPIFLLVMSILLCRFANGSELEEYDKQYKQSIYRCQAQLASKDKVNEYSAIANNPIDTSKLNCHQQAIIEAMLKQPENRELILIAVLKASPDRVSETIKSVIDFGMAPLVAMNRAIEVLPEYSDEIERGAIMAGVDSIVAMEATTTLLNIK